MEPIPSQRPPFSHPYNGHVDDSYTGELSSILARHRRQRCSLSFTLGARRASSLPGLQIPPETTREASVCSLSLQLRPPVSAPGSSTAGLLFSSLPCGGEAHKRSGHLWLIGSQLGSIVSSEDRTLWEGGLASACLSLCTEDRRRGSHPQAAQAVLPAPGPGGRGEEAQMEGC